jgi:hypothetical protein
MRQVIHTAKSHYAESRAFKGIVYLKHHILSYNAPFTSHLLVSRSS